MKCLRTSRSGIRPIGDGLTFVLSRSLVYPLCKGWLSARRITPYPYRWSEVIHRSGTKAVSEALERERAQIVNNFARGASATTNNRPILARNPRRVSGG